MKFAMRVHSKSLLPIRQGHARTINTDDKESLRQDMNRKMETASAQAVYKQRKVIVEPYLVKSKIVVFVASVFEVKKSRW